MKRVALVTGSTRGIGAEVARQLAARGHDVIVVGSRDVDVADAQSVNRLATKIDRLDVLVNNAAILLDEGKSILDVTPAEFEQTWRVNVLGAFLMTQRFAPSRRPRSTRSRSSSRRRSGATAFS